MRSGAVRFVLLVCLLALVPAQMEATASSTWVLYDNFDSGIIDPTKWTCMEEGSGFGRETQRTIVAGKLNLLERSYGYTNSNTGVAWEQQKAYTIGPRNIKAMKATVKPLKYEVVGCDNNAEPAWVAARLGGFFFNTGSAVPTDAINDVQALIGVHRRSTDDEYDDNTTVEAVVRQCTNKTCDAYNIIYNKTFGHLKNGQQTTLSLEWNKAEHKFIFKFNNKTYNYIYNTKIYPDTFPSFYSGKRLDSSTQVPNCILTSETPRPSGLMQATFESVYIKTISP
jgi:hypothetical protein